MGAVSLIKVESIFILLFLLCPFLLSSFSYLLVNTVDSEHMVHIRGIPCCEYQVFILYDSHSKQWQVVSLVTISSLC